MTSRDTILAVGSIVGYFSLLVGVLGQAGFLSQPVKPYLPPIIAAIIIILPWLIVFIITFTKQPFLPPRPFRICLLFALCWFVALTILAEILHYLGRIPPDSPQFAGTLCRVLMHIGWLSSLCIIRLYFDS